MTITTLPSTFALKAGKALLLKEANKPGDPLVDALCEKVSSDFLSEDYPWVSQPAVMQLLRDEVQRVGLNEAVVTLENDTYAVAIDFKRKDLRVDRIGILMRRIEQLVSVAQKFPRRMVAQLLESGTTDLGLDGVPIFSNSHPALGDEGGTQDNLLAGNGIASAANVQTDLGAVITTLAGLKGENGEPFNEDIDQIHVVAPWAAQGVMEEAIHAAVLNNTSNVRFARQTIVPHYVNRLTDTNDWYAFVTDGNAGRPIIYQELDPISFEVLAEGSDQWVNKEVGTAKVRWDGKFGWGHFANAVKVVNA